MSTTHLKIHFSKVLFDLMIYYLGKLLTLITRLTLRYVSVPGPWTIVLLLVSIAWISYSYWQQLRDGRQRAAEDEAVRSMHSSQCAAWEGRVKDLEKTLESKEMEVKEANSRRMSDEPLKRQLDYYRIEYNKIRRVNLDLQSELDLREMSLDKVSKEVLSYEDMNKNVKLKPPTAEATIDKSLKAMKIIYKNHCDLKTDTEAKLILLNKGSVPVPSGDDAKEDLADLRKALADKESEVQNLKSEYRDEFRRNQRHMAEKLEESIRRRCAERAQEDMRLIRIRRKVRSTSREACREVARRNTFTRLIDRVQQTKKSLEGKFKTSQLECGSLKRELDDSQAEYNSLRSKHNSLRGEHDNLQLEYRELEEAHRNSELEYRQREEELEGSINEMKEALNLSDVRVQELTSGINNGRDKASGLETALRRQTIEQKKTEVNLKRQVSRLNSILKRKTEEPRESQMVIEEAKVAVNTRDQRILDLEVALRKTAEELSQVRKEVEARGQTGLTLESENPKAEEEIPSFNHEGDNTETGNEGDSIMDDVPVDERNEEMADTPLAHFEANPMACIELSGPVQSGESGASNVPIPHSFAAGRSTQAVFGCFIQPSDAVTVAAPSGAQSVFAATPPLLAPASLPVNQSWPSPHNLVVSSPSLAAPPNLVDPTSSLAAPTSSQLSSPLSFHPSSPLSSPPHSLPPPAATLPAAANPPASATPPAATNPMVPPTPGPGVPPIATARQPPPKAGPRLAVVNWGSSEVFSSRTAEHPSLSTSVTHRAPQPGTQAASSSNPKPMALTPAEAKNLVDELFQELDLKLLGDKALSRFYRSNRTMLQQSLKLNTIAYAEQLGDHIMELLTKSYHMICEGLEKPLTEADLRPDSFNYSKYNDINKVEDRLGRIVKKLNKDFRSTAKLEISVLQLSMSKGNEAFQKAMEVQQEMMKGVPLPP